MNWSFRLARVAGIDIKVHITFFLILVLGAIQWGTPYGMAAAGWAIADGQITVDLLVPTGVTADVTLPGDDATAALAPQDLSPESAVHNAEVARPESRHRTTGRTVRPAVRRSQRPPRWLRCRR